MIIVIGKKDKALLKDAQVYLRERGDIYATEKPLFGGTKYNTSLKEDCYKIGRRICKAIGIKPSY